jgi:hypothetical protein
VLNPYVHRDVLQNGVRARASVVSVGTRVNGAARFDLPMTLQVYVHGWTPYEVEDSWMVSAEDADGLDGWIPVRVDPDDLQNVAIDWKLLRERAAAATILS